MSDAIKHECGIALLRLKKPLTFYLEKYGSAFFLGGSFEKLLIQLSIAEWADRISEVLVS